MHWCHISKKLRYCMKGLPSSRHADRYFAWTILAGRKVSRCLIGSTTCCSWLGETKNSRVILYRLCGGTDNLKGIRIVGLFPFRTMLSGAWSSFSKVFFQRTKSKEPNVMDETECILAHSSVIKSILNCESLFLCSFGRSGMDNSTRVSTQKLKFTHQKHVSFTLIKLFHAQPEFSNFINVELRVTVLMAPAPFLKFMAYFCSFVITV